MIKEIKSVCKVGCPICMNPEIGTIVNQRLVDAKMSIPVIVDYLVDEYGIYLTIKDIEVHRTHLFTILKDELSLLDEANKLIENVSEISNLEMINNEIAKLSALETQMIAMQRHETPAYNNILRAKQKYIELKMKIEGEDLTVIEHKIPDWISLRDRE